MIDWTTIATWVLAGVALLALLANVYQAKQTKRAVDAATAETVAAIAETKAVQDQTGALIRQAEASERQAKASQTLAEEARRTRELEWQPLLNWDRTTRVWNTGHGHAYRAVVVFRINERAIQVSRPIPVGLSSSNEIVEWLDYPNPPGGILTEHAAWAVFCEDQSGSTIASLTMGHVQRHLHRATRT